MESVREMVAAFDYCLHGKGGAAPQAEEDLLNFSQPWPDNVKFDEDPQVEIVSEDKEANRYVYESASFRFVCDVRLSKTVVKGFAVMFESTYRYCRALPLAITGASGAPYAVRLLEARLHLARHLALQPLVAAHLVGTERCRPEDRWLRLA